MSKSPSDPVKTKETPSSAGVSGIRLLDCSGLILDLKTPVVMGILNITPDSFYDGGSYLTHAAQLKQTEKMLLEGASIIDIGAVSTRPGSDPVSEKEEIERMIPALKLLKSYFPKTIFSVDSYRSKVAKVAIDNGAGMINDIFGGRFDEKVIKLVAKANVPYIIMHMQGVPSDMQINPHYKDVLKEVKEFFAQRLSVMPKNFNQIILDPGFGFGKSIEHNYRLLANLESFREFNHPVMAGMSRKSMINRVLHVNPIEALNGTTVLNTIALIKGVDILRVHDVKEAVQAIRLVGTLNR
jgi:dihydropteroate synthase